MDHFRFLQHYNRVKSGLLHNCSTDLYYLHFARTDRKGKKSALADSEMEGMEQLHTGFKISF